MNTKRCKTCKNENVLTASTCRICGGNNFEQSLIPDISTIHTLILQRALPRIPKFFWIILIICLFVVALGVMSTYYYAFIRPPKPIIPRLPDALGEIAVPPGQHEQMIGVNDGSFPPFDIGRPDEPDKQAAAQAHNDSDALSSWNNALKRESNDAEALIYKENQHIVNSGSPYVSFVVATTFAAPFPNKESEEVLQGAYTAQHEANSNPNTIHIRLLIANTGSDTNNVKSVAQQIVHIASKQKIVAVIGWLTSTDSNNAIKTLGDAHIPLISSSATSDDLNGYTNFFRVVPPNHVQALLASQLALHLSKKQSMKIVVFLDKKDLYSQNLATDFERNLPGGVFKEIYFTASHTNFTPLISKALELVPDMFYFISPHNSDTEQFEDDLPSSGPSTLLPIISGDGGYAIHKNAYGRWYFTALAYPDEWKIFAGGAPFPPFFTEYSSYFDPAKKFSSGYYDYDRPSQQTMLTYDATMVLLKSLQLIQEKNSKINGDDLIGALSQIDSNHPYQGVTGQIAFDMNHNPINKTVLVLRASPEGFTEIYPDLLGGCYRIGCSVPAS